MAWDVEISKQLHAFFHDGNVVEFERLLRAHPQHLRAEDGADIWMWKAALHGRLPIIQALV